MFVMHPNLTEQNRVEMRLAIIRKASELNFCDTELLAVLVEMTSEVIANRYPKVDDCLRLVDAMSDAMRDAVRCYPDQAKRERNGRFLSFESHVGDAVDPAETPSVATTNIPPWLCEGAQHLLQDIFSCHEECSGEEWDAVMSGMEKVATKVTCLEPNDYSVEAFSAAFKLLGFFTYASARRQFLLDVAGEDDSQVVESAQGEAQ